MRRTDTVTIAINTATSSSIQLQRNVPVMLYMASSFTGTAILFETSNDGGSTWKRLYFGGADYQELVAANKSVPVRGGLFLGADHVRLVSNATELGARTISVVSWEDK